MTRVAEPLRIELGTTLINLHLAGLIITETSVSWGYLNNMGGGGGVASQ